eukprot:4507702-Pyramimonas_sp.AAC.1
MPFLRATACKGLVTQGYLLHPCLPVTDSKVSARHANGAEWCYSIGMVGYGAWVDVRGPDRQ